MSTNYTGSKTGNHSPATSPSPGQAPVVVVPADTDPNNVATMFTQQYPVLADYIDWIQASAGMCPPFLRSGATGFSTITHIGAGGGTVTPSGNVKIQTGTNFVIKIILGGSVATATFQTSINGGTTYGGTQTTAASMTDATSGITLAFSGVFVAADTYQFNSAFTPMMTYANTDGYIRHQTDHNGYRMGRITELSQNWAGINPAGGTPAAAAFIDGNTWSTSGHGSASYGLTSNSFGGSTGLNLYQGLTGSTSASYNFVYTTNGLFVPDANTVAVAEFEMLLDHSGATNVTWQIGFTNNTSNTALSSDNLFVLEQVSGDTTWHVRTQDGATSNRVDTGVNIDTANFQRIKMELYGQNSPYGKLARVFINDQGPFEFTSNLPFGTSGLMLFWGQHAHYISGTMPSQFLYMSPLKLVWNRLPGSTVAYL